MSLSKETPRDPSVVRRNLRYWREERRMTTRQLGKRLGLSHSGITDLERGTRHVTMETFFRIAEVLGVEIVRFFEEPPAHHSGELPEEDPQ